MKLIKQMLCFALALLMLFSVVACGPRGGGNNGGGDDDDDAEETTTINTWDDLPDIDMKGKEIILRSWVQPANAKSYDADRDGDVINNSVYDRVAALEKRLKCNYTNSEQVIHPGAEIVTEMKGLAGAPSYHVVTTASYVMDDLAAEGLLIDLAKQERVDLEKPYYDDGYNVALKIGNRQYLVTGKLSLGWYRYQVVTLFNRNLFKQSQIAFPYQTVLDGDWTLAKMQETANLMYKDLNRDTKYDANDQYGYYVFVGGASSQTDGYMAAWNLRISEKSADGYFQVYSGYDPTPWVAACNDYLDMIGDVGSYSFKEGNGNDIVEKKFTAGEAGMINFRMYTVETEGMVALSRNKEGYGIVPLPKANGDQTDYISYVQDQVPLFGVPNTMKGEDRTYATHFLEAFASESFNTTVPAYYEKALTKKYVIDAPSKAMIEIIDSNIEVDPANIFNSISLNTTSLRSIYSGEKKVNDVLSQKIAADGSGTMKTTIEKLNKLYQDLDAQLTSIGE